jgi:hypothetical protein
MEKLDLKCVGIYHRQMKSIVQRFYFKNLNVASPFWFGTSCLWVDHKQ